MNAPAPLTAASPQAAVTVEEVRDRRDFLRLAPQWQALVRRADDQLFYRHDFLRVWIDNFAPGAQLRVLTVRGGDGRLTAALPLMRRRATLLGVPIVELSATANAHSCRFDLVAEDPTAAAHVLLAHLAADPRWDVLRLSDVPENGAGFRLLEVAREAGLPVGTWVSLNSPTLALPTNVEAMQEALQAKFKANLRRRRKKLEELGPVTLERVEGGLELDAKLEEGLLLEASGWKGRRGTAIAQSAGTRGFYAELAREAAGRGELVLYFLRVGGRAVAFHYALCDGQRYLLLKPGYDESIKECSPGQLLMEAVIRDCIERGVRELDFLGPDMPWKRDWTTQVRPHSWLYIFRNTPFGRALCSAKFRWAPLAKELVERWRS